MRRMWAVRRPHLTGVPGEGGKGLLWGFLAPALSGVVQPLPAPSEQPGPAGQKSLRHTGLLP